MELYELFNNSDSVNYKAKEIILRPTEKPACVFFVEKGHVKVYSLTEWGDEKLHLIFKEREFFPVLWTFKDIPLECYYEAMDKVILRKIPSDDFLDFIKSDNKALYQVMQLVVKIHEVYKDRVEDLEYTNGYARVVSRLLSLSKRFGVKRGKKIVVDVPLTHKDIANSVALTRETTSREFEVLQKKGLIGYRNHRIIIHDIEALQKDLSAHYDNRKI